MSNLTDKQYLELCKLSYLFEGSYYYVIDKMMPTSPSLSDLANALLYDTVVDEHGADVPIALVDPDKGTIENGGLFDKDFRDTLMFIKNDPILSELEFIEYRNNNSSTGFVGMVFKDAGDNRSPQRHAA